MPDPEMTPFLLRTCHDLRTPLRAVLTYSELLSKDINAQGNRDLEQRLGFVVEGAKKANRLLDALADYATVRQIERSEFRTTPVDVLLRIALAKLAKELEENHGEVTYDPLPGIPGHADRLVQLFEHLLRNTLRHRGAADPRAHVSAHRQDEAWLFMVHDNGPGVEAEYLERIFEPFVRLNGTHHTGTGLGLTICRAIVERHGGKIWAELNPGGGCRFLFTLPAE